MSKQTLYTSKNWLGKTAAGVILGFGLAIALSGLFAWLGPMGLEGGSGKLQLTMWITAPIWITVISTCFLFKTGLRAWAWLGAANIIAFAGLYLARTMLG